MLLRKINAGISLLVTALLLYHAIFYSVWMLSGFRIERPLELLSWIMLGGMAFHVFISIDLAVSGHLDSEKGKGRFYPKQNVSTLVQRISGILMILLLVLHLTGSANHYQPKWLHTVLHPLFFATAMAHTSVSAGKALITLGIGTAKTIRGVEIAMKLIGGATMVAGTVGFLLCLFVGVAR